MPAVNEVYMPNTGETFVQLETRRGPWSELFKISQVLCADGVRRTAHISGQPDTFFSIPAKVKVQGKNVSGYVTRETLQGYSTPSKHDCAAWKFVAYTYGKHAHLLPEGAFKLASGGGVVAQ